MSVITQGALNDVHTMQQALINRFLTADAISLRKRLALPPKSLSSDERSLLDDFVARGVVVEHRGEYYLDQDTLNRETRKSPFRFIVGVLALVALVGAMVWYVGSLR